MKLTKIAIALAAVLAMSALTASAASALTYNASAANVMLFGTQTSGTQHKFTVDGQNTECNSANFEVANVANGANEVKPVTAAYNNCTAFGFAANVTMGTCHYTFGNPYQDANHPNEPNTPMANVGITCNNNANVNGNATNNGDIRINANVFGSVCEVHVQTQNHRPTASFHNDMPNPGHVRITVVMNTIEAEVTADNGLCPLSGTGTRNNAAYIGNTDVEGTGGVNIAVS